MDALQSVYCKACVRYGNISPWFDINISIKLGCVLSFMVLYLDKYIQRFRSLNVGIRMGDSVVICRLYADDVVFLGSTPSVLQTLITDMNVDNMNMAGLQMNVSPFSYNQILKC